MAEYLRHCGVPLVNRAQIQVIPLQPVERVESVAVLNKRIAHGEKLFNAAISPKLHLWVEKANHNDLFWVAGEKYSQTLQEFTNLVKANQQLSHPNNS